MYYLISALYPRPEIYIQINEASIYHAPLNYSSGRYSIHEGNTHQSNRTYIYNGKLFNTAYLREVLSHCKVRQYRAHVVIPKSVTGLEQVQLLIILQQAGINPYSISTTPLSPEKQYSYYWLLSTRNKLININLLRQTQSIIILSAALFTFALMSGIYAHKKNVILQEKIQQQSNERTHTYKKNSFEMKKRKKLIVHQQSNAQLSDLMTQFISFFPQEAIIRSLQVTPEKLTSIILSSSEITEKIDALPHYQTTIKTKKLPHSFAPYNIESKIVIARAKSAY